MHISEGVLSPAVLAGGAALGLAGVAVGLRRSDYERLSLAAALASVFFVASLAHVPLGPGNVHLLLNGMLGLFLGWAAFPALLAALVLQAVLFRYGGLAVLGANVFCLAFPALLCHYLFRGWVARGGKRRALGAFACGALPVAGAGLCVAAALWLSDESFAASARLIFLAHVPVMVLEGIIMALAVSFVGRTRPELLVFKQRRDAAADFADAGISGCAPGGGDV